jgi:hypothetical protein
MAWEFADGDYNMTDETVWLSGLARQLFFAPILEFVRQCKVCGKPDD